MHVPIKMAPSAYFSRPTNCVFPKIITSTILYQKSYTLPRSTFCKAKSHNYWTNILYAKITVICYYCFQFIDGWELNGQFYPSSSDHHMPLEERIREFCDNGKAKYILRSSQNVALLQYRLPMLRTGFKFFVRLSQNPTRK